MHEHAESDGKTECPKCRQNWHLRVGFGCANHPHLPNGISLHHFVDKIVAEIFRARLLYNRPEGVGFAMTEEMGEVADAVLCKSRADVIHEAVQACAMLARLALEGDPSIAALRAARGLDV